MDEIPWQPWLQVAWHTQVCADHYMSLIHDHFIKQTIFLINQLPSWEQHAFLRNAQEHSGVQKWFFCVRRKCQANLTEDIMLLLVLYENWQLSREKIGERTWVGDYLSIDIRELSQTWDDQGKAWLALLPRFIFNLTNFLSSSEYYRIPSCKNAYGMEWYCVKHFLCLWWWQILSSLLLHGKMGREKPGQELTEEGFAPAHGLEDI